MKPSKEYQWPKVQRLIENDMAGVKTYVGEVMHGNSARVSPRRNEIRDNAVLDKLEAQLREHLEALQPA